MQRLLVLHLSPKTTNTKNEEKKYVKDLKGTKHSGIIQNNKGLEMNLQFFAENDVPKQSSASLKRAIRNLTKRIKEHEEYIENPYVHVPEWDEYSALRQEGLKKH